MGFEGGTGKAEDAKLPGAGISAKPCPRKCVAEKEQVPTSVKSICSATARQPPGGGKPFGSWTVSVAGLAQTRICR